MSNLGFLLSIVFIRKRTSRRRVVPINQTNRRWIGGCWWQVTRWILPESGGIIWDGLEQTYVACCKSDSCCIPSPWCCCIFAGGTSEVLVPLTCSVGCTSYSIFLYLSWISFELPPLGCSVVDVTTSGVRWNLEKCTIRLILCVFTE